MRSARLLLALLAALALASCGDDEPAAEPAATAAPATESTAEPAPAEDPVEPSGGGGASPYIGSLSVDPGDGTLMIGTGLGLYRLEPGERRARKLEGALETPEGAGTISANLELLHLGPGELLASGHPQSGDLPENIGLVRSGRPRRHLVAGLGPRRVRLAPARAQPRPPRRRARGRDRALHQP